MSTEKVQRHNERMKRHKKVVDAKIEKASIERGVLIVITGNGKGKTTSALGTLLRSLGHGHQCALAQFIKGQWDCGETRFFSHTENLTTFTMNTGFTWNTQDFESDKQAAEAVWKQILPLFSNPDCQLIVMDEITYMFKYNYLDIDELVKVLNNRPEHQNVIITGRAAPQALINIADTVSEITPVKHAFNQGIKAQEGIEW
ncbi:MAG: cob(I)yrinic acid a,c-diamide adenosyltransferase [gamma proteobacterium symbiont of Bathyaustriella thionipta]|nr:cob(I)yrinic acid a,c-diamide adenosyltransferase [gamma proteobacterium symbiont of Bathyaustriella thionipta]MCU7949796.1 cob(I)yrinic acid a,c-diamide adenosyltransferase [gamma proteobacterium symbiont of Bathyaustriella thionipta]MCU7954235.1 cob(I)yrinic acid a,c-diamide adenosyltransferase [gamma proteobacterium symbiont of Bathyaustriella thionipta]MCU7956390.1 cob(I)yrinic acid a,c-diamide adenosyltransferase [gamma proteobacterium symbiont of Bathyaustriella thionipta]MCU7968516.1 